MRNLASNSDSLAENCVGLHNVIKHMMENP